MDIWVSLQFKDSFNKTNIREKHLKRNDVDPLILNESSLVMETGSSTIANCTYHGPFKMNQHKLD